ncbi:MAG: hypothetical protein K8T10_00695 [Candidatus Eremiobacteraeota bacterium]|nr:hypothetical protein [Candidatus Eremiobacteraeota bacterium]
MRKSHFKKALIAIVFIFLFLVGSQAVFAESNESLPPYQLKIGADSGTFGKWEIEVWVGKKYVGKFTKVTNKDITPYMKWGKNIITVSSKWKENTSRVELTVGVKHGKKWMTTMNYVQMKKGAEVRKFPVVAYKGLPSSPVVQGQYVMKISCDSGMLGLWTIWLHINDKLVGVYNGWGSVDVSNYLKPGKNIVKVSGKWKKETYPVKLTIGGHTGKKWRTVVNFANRKPGKIAKKFSFDARPLGGEDSSSFENNHILKVSADSDTLGKWEMEISINGETIQTLTAPTSIEINDFMKKGKNTLVIKGKWTKDTSPVKLTIGARKGKKWRTLANFVRNKKGSFTKKFLFIGK